MGVNVFKGSYRIFSDFMGIRGFFKRFTKPEEHPLDRNTRLRFGYDVIKEGKIESTVSEEAAIRFLLSNPEKVSKGDFEKAMFILIAEHPHEISKAFERMFDLAVEILRKEEYAHLGLDIVKFLVNQETSTSGQELKIKKLLKAYEIKEHTRFKKELGMLLGTHLSLYIHGTFYNGHEFALEKADFVRSTFNTIENPLPGIKNAMYRFEKFLKFGTLKDL